MKIYDKPTEEHYIKGKKHKQPIHNATNTPVHDGIYREYTKKQKKKKKQNQHKK